MPRRTCITVILLVLLAAALPATPTHAQGGPTFDLRPIWEDGQTARYQSSTRQVTTMEMASHNARRTSVMDIQGELLWEVFEADDAGGGRCRITVEQLTVTATGPDGQSYTIDRNQAPEPMVMLQTLLRALMDHPVTVTVEADGSVSDVQGWKAVKRAGGDAAQNLEAGDFRETAWELAPLMGGLADAVLGATWDNECQWSHEMGQLNLRNDYKLAGYEQIDGVDLLTIAMTSDVDVEVDRDKIPDRRQGMQMDLQFKGGSQSGQVYFDPARHEVFARHLARETRFQIDIQIRDRDIRQTITRNVITQVLRIDEQ